MIRLQDEQKIDIKDEYFWSRWWKNYIYLSKICSILLVSGACLLSTIYFYLGEYFLSFLPKNYFTQVYMHTLLRLVLVKIIFTDPPMFFKIVDLLSNLISRDFIMIFIRNQLKKLLQLDGLVSGSKRLFKEKILKEMVLGTDLWDKKICYIVLIILRNEDVKKLTRDSLVNLIRSPQIEDLLAGQLVTTLKNDYYRDSINSKLKSGIRDYLQDFNNMYAVSKGI